jgi:hypothetical protein
MIAAGKRTTEAGLSTGDDLEALPILDAFGTAGSLGEAAGA